MAVFRFFKGEVIIEQTSTGLSAYSPDLPACAVTGAMRAEVEKEMREAIEFHLEGLRLEVKPFLRRARNRPTARFSVLSRHLSAPP